MNRLAALILGLVLSGCAELEELIVGDCYDDWQVAPPPSGYPPAPAVLPSTAPPPLAQPAPVPPVIPTSFPGTTQEPPQ